MLHKTPTKTPTNFFNLSLKYHQKKLSNPFHENTPLMEFPRSKTKIKISPIKHTVSSMNKNKNKENQGNNVTNNTSHFTEIQENPSRNVFMSSKSISTKSVSKIGVSPKGNKYI